MLEFQSFDLVISGVWSTTLPFSSTTMENGVLFKVPRDVTSSKPVSFDRSQHQLSSNRYTAPLSKRIKAAMKSSSISYRFIMASEAKAPRFSGNSRPIDALTETGLDEPPTQILKSSPCMLAANAAPPEVARL